MLSPRNAGLLACLILALVAIPGGPAAAEIRPSAGLLLPYFEVDLTPDRSLTTLFAVCNGSDEAVDVQFSLTTNWGIPVITFTRRLQPDEVLTANLRDWLLYGRLPNGKTLTAGELAHIQAALSGKPSPKDGLYYGTEVLRDRAIGAITMRVQSFQHRDVLWGDYFTGDTAQNVCLGNFQADNLVLLDPTPAEDALCTRHGIRFLQAGPFKDGTEVVFWTDRRLLPSPTPEPLFGDLLTVRTGVYSEPGLHVEDRSFGVLPVETVQASDLHLTPSFGWLDINTGEDRSYVGVHYNSAFNSNAAFHSYCLPEEAAAGGAGLRFEKMVNGETADTPPGPSITIGTDLLWEFTVTNTGTVPLTEITVTDDTGLPVSCPASALEPGETLVCTAHGKAAACQNHNVGRVQAQAPDGPLFGDDGAYYLGVAHPALSFEATVNAQNADTPPGPQIPAGRPVDWVYQVGNTGDVDLAGVKVTDDHGLAITCPKTTLAKGETMICTAAETASGLGQHAHVATVTANPPCAASAVSASDPGYYFVPGAPAIALRKLTNGQDADTEPGPTIEVGQPVTWQYLVTNTGGMMLTGIIVNDDRGVAVTCPKASLAAGESMTCTGQGVATACQYTNVATVRASVVPPGEQVTAQDTSHYFGRHHAAVAIETYTNGDPADSPTGPVLTAGSAVHWTYTVTNSGDVPLSAVQVTDDHGYDVACPKSALAVGESMTCTANGTATRGQYRNVGAVTATPPCGTNVAASDPSHYLGVQPGVAIEKLINGEEADNPPGILVHTGDRLLWTYVVTNTGDVALSALAVTDDQGVAVTCPGTSLPAGGSMVCTGSGIAQAAQGPKSLKCNVGTVTGTSPQGVVVKAQDPSCYTIAAPGDQGCSHGYWKNHTGAWAAAGYSPSQPLVTVFSQASRYPSLASVSMYDALSLGGGSGVEEAAQILMQQAVAAALNAVHPGISSPLTSAQVVAAVNAALASENRSTLLTLSAQLDADNNLGCPLH